VIVTEPWSWTHGADDGVVPGVAEWHSGEPLVIRVIFDSHGDSVLWVFARELLHAAFRHGEAGVGDVNVKIAEGTLYLALHSPFGQATMRCEAARFAGFLTRTYAVVPETAEDLTPAVDAALDKILGRPG
jgi:hypothetical protein